MLRNAVRATLASSFRPASARTISPALALARRYLSADTRAKIQAAVDKTPVVLFMKGTPAQPQCGFSRAAVQVLDMHGVPHEKLAAYNILEDAELRAGIKEFSEWPTIPQIYVNGEFVGGCDILLSMHQSGELEELLEKHKVIAPVEESETINASPST